MAAEVQVEITKILVERFGIRRAEMTPASRLLHDLGIEADDAIELFQELHRRYGTDFTALYESWQSYFNNECISRRGFLIAVLVIIPMAGLYGALFASLGFSYNAALLGCFIVTATVWWLADRIVPKRRLRAITIAEVVETVR